MRDHHNNLLTQDIDKSNRLVFPHNDLLLGRALGRSEADDGYIDCATAGAFEMPLADPPFFRHHFRDWKKRTGIEWCRQAQRLGSRSYLQRASSCASICRIDLQRTATRLAFQQWRLQVVI